MARKRRLLWQLFLPFFIIVIASLSAVAWYSSSSLSRFYREQIRRELEERALMARRLLLEDLENRRYSSIQRRTRDMGRETSTRLTVILPSGKVVADSDEDPANMDNHRGRPEVKKALSGAMGLATRYSDTLKKKMMYLALPLRGSPSGGKAGRGARRSAGGGRIAGQPDTLSAVVRVSIPMMTVSEKVRGIYVDILTGGAVVAVLAALVSFWVSHRINRPILEMRQGAERFADGDLAYRLAPSDTEEVAALADAMNHMAQQLGERIDEITTQRNEREAVLSSMVEAVFAVDVEERIIRCNGAAKELFGVPQDEVVLGRAIQEVTRNPELQEFVSKTLSTSQAVSGEIVYHNGGDRTLYAQGTRLRDEGDSSMGALVVLHDVTRLKRLEAIRKEFVANVSHELKTPIASIKGSAETLKDGAIQDPEGAAQFLGIILRHTERLASIINDLLTLSRIEQDEGEELLETSRAPLAPVLHSACLATSEKAKNKSVEVKTSCPADLKAVINPRLFEHAVINLLDNAIKYSEEKAVVALSAREVEDEVWVRVRDNGCGIPKKYHKRLFERFYRVDKARSRKLGGTGLGLAIVKHIATAHGGSVEVESVPDEGSTFTLRLPKKTEGRTGAEAP